MKDIRKLVEDANSKFPKTMAALAASEARDSERDDPEWVDTSHLSRRDPVNDERDAIVEWLLKLDDAAENRWHDLNWFQKLFNRKYDATHARLAHAIIRKFKHREAKP